MCSHASRRINSDFILCTTPQVALAHYEKRIKRNQHTNKRKKIQNLSLKGKI